LKSKQIQKFRETEIKTRPRDWKTKELQEISRVIDSAHVTPEYSLYGYPMIRVTDIKPGFLNLVNSLKVSDEVYEEFTKNHKPVKNDIVMSRVGTYGISSYVYTDEPFCLGQNTVVIHSSISRFIYCALNSKQVKYQIEERVVGSTQKTISLANIRKLRIALPTNLEEIKRIEKILFSFDLHINALLTQNHVLEKIIQSIFKSWFVDFDGQTKFVDSELGQIPKGWKVGLINDVIKLFDFQRIPISEIQRDSRHGDFPYYGASGIIDYIDDYIFDGEYLLIAEDGENLRSRKTPVVFFANGKFWVNNHAHVIQGKNNVNNDFLWVFFKDLDLSPWITGAAQPKLNQDSLLSIPIVIPETKILLKFNLATRSLSQSIRNNLQKIIILEKIRDSLLPKLMSGKIRI
jgi:type I restriction enzyme S subunit